MKAIIVTLVLATSVSAAASAQTAPIKWPDQVRVERSKWPELYAGPIDQTATICIDVTPRPAMPARASFSAHYELFFKPDTQFRVALDGDQRYISPGRGSMLIAGLDSIRPGRHTIELDVRQPASYARLTMMLHTEEDGDLPDAIHPCSAVAPPPAPKPSPKELVEPIAAQIDTNLNLSPEPDVIAPPEVSPPSINMAQYGDPFAKLPPTTPNGPGSGGGIGSGSGGGVSAPVPLYKPEPVYSEEANEAKFQGTVMLALVVDVDGTAKDIRVVRSLGMGLDERAVEAVGRWRFRPAMKDGQPVPVKANVEINFRLLNGAAAAVPAKSPAGAAAVDCGLGATWTEEEAGYQSTWTRRGTSNVFDAKYLNGQTTINQVSISGATVSAQRMSSSDGYLCSYQGSIGADRITVTGTYTCPSYGSRPWKAVINCGPREEARPPNQGGTPLVTRTAAAASPAAIHAASPSVSEEPHRTQVDRDKWPDYVEPLTPSQWPVFFSGRVEKSAAICIEVDPKGSPASNAPFDVNYHLTVNPAVQFRVIVDEEEEVPPSRPNAIATGTFSLQRGKHTVEVVVRVPGESVQLAMLLRTKETGDSPEAVRLCGAKAAPPVSPEVRAAVIYKCEMEPSREYLETTGEVKVTVKLKFTVGVDGKAHDITVMQSAGKGQDEKAIEALSKWKFRPATTSGRAVPETLIVDFNYHKL